MREIWGECKEIMDYLEKMEKTMWGYIKFLDDP